MSSAGADRTARRSFTQVTYFPQKFDADTSWVLKVMESVDADIMRRINHNLLYKLSLGPVTLPDDDTDRVYLATGEWLSNGVMSFIFEQNLTTVPMTSPGPRNGSPLNELGIKVLKALDRLYGPCDAARTKPAANLNFIS